MPARVAVIYYSATGNVHALAQAVAEGAAETNAEVRCRPVEELAWELAISQNQLRVRHRSAVQAEPVAGLDDLDWADGIAFGTPTRFGNVSAQLKNFIDQAGELWQQGRLTGKVATSFTSSQTVHGGQESTILALNNTLYHWGVLVLPLGYAVEVLDPEAEKGVSGTEVRARMRSGGDWKSLVPPPVVRVIEALSLERAPNRRLAV